MGVELLHSTTSANTLDRPGQRLPEPIRRLWPTLATEPSYPVFSGLLTLGFRLSLLLEDPRMETLTVRALASLETQRGVLDRETRSGR